jgi:hypothetical protein
VHSFVASLNLDPGPRACYTLRVETGELNMGIFDSVEMSPEQQDARNRCQSSAELLYDSARRVKNGRYKSLFQTKLEEAMMFLNKAIAHDGIE